MKQLYFIYFFYLFCFLHDYRDHMSRRWEKSRAERWNCSMIFSLRIHIQSDWNLFPEIIRRWFHEKKYIFLCFQVSSLDDLDPSRSSHRNNDRFNSSQSNHNSSLRNRIYVSFYLIMLWFHFLLNIESSSVFFGQFIMNFSSMDFQHNVSVGVRAHARINSTAKVSLFSIED